MKSFLGALLPRPVNATKPPVPLTGRTAGGMFGAQLHQRGATEALSAMEAAGTVFGIVDRLATSVSLVEWKLWRKAKSGKKEDRTEVTSHAALDLLETPNQFTSRQELFEAGQQHQDLTGETWLVIGRSARASMPLELWTVRPDRMEPVPSAELFLAGYVYRSPDGEPVPLEVKDVVFIRRPDPRNPYRGLGPIRSVAPDIDSTRYSMEWNKAFFLNSAEPGGIIEVPKSLSDVEFEELRERWNEQHRGVVNAHRVAILEHGKWIDRKITQREMQFAELRGVTEGGIKQAFGFPKFALGEVDDVNRAQGEASIAMYGKWLLVPRLERWKGALNRRVLPQFGTTAVGLEFDYESPVPEDSEAENAARTSKVGAVAQLVPLGFDPAESLKVFGLPDIPWKQPEPPAPPPGAGVDVGGLVPGKGKDPLQALLAPPRMSNQAPPDDPELAQVQAQWEAALAEVTAAWPGVAAGQKAELQRQVEDAVASGDVSALAELTVGTGAAAAVLLAALAALAAASGAGMAAGLAAQGAPLVAAAAVPGLSQVASATASLLGSSMAAVVGRDALRFATPGADPADVASKVIGRLPALGVSERMLTDEVGGALSLSQAQGRLLTARAVEVAAGGDPGDPDDPVPPVFDDGYIPQVIYSSAETLDRNTCLPCWNVDGTVYDRWIDAWVDYAGGIYAGCLGGKRCRGQVVARWNPQAGA